MKRILLILLSGMFLLSINAQTYHEQDKEGLRKILRQKGTAYTTDELPVKAYTTTVFEMVGLTESDTLTWNNNEDWVEKLTWLRWSETTPKRLVFFNWGTGIEYTHFDLSYFDDITGVSVGIMKYTMPRSYLPSSINVGENEKLEEVYLAGCSLLGAHPNNKIERVSIYDGMFYNEELQLLPHLKNFRLMNSYYDGIYDFANNPLIERIEVKDGRLAGIKASTNDNLKYMDCSYNLLTTLSVSDVAPLDTLICDYNQLWMFDMPYRSFELYRAGPQNTKYNSEGHYGYLYDYKGIAYIEDGLDLSAYVSVRGVNSNMVFFSYESNEGFFDLTHVNGIFGLTPDLVGKRLTCAMGNSCIPGVDYQIAFDIESRGTTVSIEDAFKDNNIDVNTEGLRIIVKAREIGEFSLYNMRGQKMSSGSLNTATTEISVASSGLYLLKVMLDNGSSKTFKVTVK